jgi:hypothetical protein
MPGLINEDELLGAEVKMAPTSRWRDQDVKRE